MGRSLFESYKNSPGSFKDDAERPSTITHFGGGSRRTNQVFISGYGAVLINPPKAMFGNDASAYKSAQDWFHGTAESFTPHGTTLRQTDLPIMGGGGYSIPTGRDVNRTISVGFREWQNLPMIQMLDLWTSIYNPYYGLSDFCGKRVNPSNYKGTLWYISFKPGGNYNDDSCGNGGGKFDESLIEQCYFYDGVFPQSSPHDSFNYDISTTDSVLLNVSFSFDGYPLTKAIDGVLEAAVKKLNEVVDFEDTYKRVLDPQTNALNQEMTGEMSTFGTNRGR